MGKVCRIASLAALALLLAAPLASHAQTQTPAFDPSGAQRFADGNDWTKASLDEKQAFVFGIANAISVALGWDERHVPPDQVTFSRRARDGLAGTTLGEAVTRIDAWYAANPSRLATPVVAVMWLEIAKPKLKPAK
jgi:hypothetical protein